MTVTVYVSIWLLSLVSHCFSYVLKSVKKDVSEVAAPTTVELYVMSQLAGFTVKLGKG